MDDLTLHGDNKDNGSFNISLELYDWIESIVFSLVTVVLFFTFAFRIVGVQGQSMQQTLQDKDRLILTSYFYEPKHGDVVVVSRENNLAEPLIKRVIALEGETVNIDYNTNTVTVNGKPVANDLTHVNNQTFGGDVMTPIDSSRALVLPYTVPSGYVFVMGDNRNNSLDSRFKEVGALKKNQILGKAIFRIYRESQFRKSFWDMFGVVK